MPMVMEYEYNENGSMEHITFTGLNGNEFTGNIKNALGLLKVENPKIAFTNRVRAGEYDYTPDDEYDKKYKIIEFISSLWRYPDAGEGQNEECEMNVLMLLANAIKVASLLYANIRRQDTENNDWEDEEELIDV